MSIVSFVTEVRQARALLAMPRARVIALREERLRRTLTHAFAHSAFYRELWSAHGLGAGDLAHVPLSELPVVTKSMLMERFSDAVTAPGISLADAEAFVARDVGGFARYRSRYIALVTSGSSGRIGLFLYTPEFWRRVFATVFGCVAGLSLTRALTRRTRVAFLGEGSGHHGGISAMHALPFPALSWSIDADAKDSAILSGLSAFGPHVLFGYPSAIARVAQLVHSGQLGITPERIIVSGEPLTPACADSIRRAFGRRAIDLYGATECLAIGADFSEEGRLDLFDHLAWVETVDDADRPARTGVPGHVVLTVFGNEIQPLVRYRLDDEMVLEEQRPDRALTVARRVMGRALERLHLVVPQRTVDVHPMELVGLFVPDLRQYQVVQEGERRLRIRVIPAARAGERVCERMRATIDGVLASHGLEPGAVEVQVERVEEIPTDARTGKTPLIVPLPAPGWTADRVCAGK